MFSNKLSAKLTTLKLTDEWKQLTLQQHRVIRKLREKH